jgi:hypothetical protein
MDDGTFSFGLKAVGMKVSLEEEDRRADARGARSAFD